MSTSLIKTVFLVIGSMLVATLIFELLFSSAGQTFMWNAIEPAMQDQWEEVTMDNGAVRSEIYEKQFNDAK